MSIRNEVHIPQPLTGEIGHFGDIPMFTDCAMQKDMVLIGAHLLDIVESNKGLPHSCSTDKRCSRWKIENPQETP